MRSMSFDPTELDDVPLPSQVPSPVTISETLKQKAPGTFDSLLSQNQDLMNRLSISLKRNLELETQFGQSIERNRYLELQAHTLHVEMSTINQRNSELEKEFISLINQRNLAEQQYAELQIEMTERITRLSRAVSRFNKYHQRIKKIVRPFIDRLNKKYDSEKRFFETHLTENLELRERNEQFKQQLTDAYTRIQEQHTEHEKEKRQLVESYETKLQFYLHEVEQVKKDFQHISTQFDDIQSRNQLLVEKQALLENKAILAERRHADLRTQTDVSISELQNELIALRTENQKLNVEKMSLEESLASMNDSLVKTSKEHDSIAERYTGLQAIWEETTQKLAEAQDQIQSLQKLNRELSKNMTEKRRELESIQDRLKKTEERSTQKMQVLFENIKGLKREEVSVQEDTSYVKKLESLINELEIRP